MTASGSLTLEACVRLDVVTWPSAIVSHIPDDAAFFRTPPRCRDRLYAVLAATGAKALVYKIARRPEPGAGWRTLEAGYYAYLLSNGPSDAPAAGCRHIDETDR